MTSLKTGFWKHPLSQHRKLLGASPYTDTVATLGELTQRRLTLVELNPFIQWVSAGRFWVVAGALSGLGFVFALASHCWEKGGKARAWEIQAPAYLGQRQGQLPRTPLPHESFYLASNNNGVEDHFVVREVVMAFESAFTDENSHSPLSRSTRPILPQAPETEFGNKVMLQTWILADTK